MEMSLEHLDLLYLHFQRPVLMLSLDMVDSDAVCMPVCVFVKGEWDVVYWLVQSCLLTTSAFCVSVPTLVTTHCVSKSCGDAIFRRPWQ